VKWNFKWDDVKLGSCIGDAHYGPHGLVESLNRGRLVDAKVELGAHLRVPFAEMGKKISEWMESMHIKCYGYTNKDIIVVDVWDDHIDAVYSYDGHSFGIIQLNRKK
jgi:hypothetical protein